MIINKQTFIICRYHWLFTSGAGFMWKILILRMEPACRRKEMNS
jgi:hypothetical protein